MKLTRLTLAACALGLFGLAPLGANPPADETKAEYSFREAPVNSLGIRSLAELRGKPVLIDFWGIN